MAHWLLPVDTTSIYNVAHHRDVNQPLRFPYPTYLPLEAKPGDQVLFWRTAFGSGIVAQGAIVDQVPIETLNSLLLHTQDHGGDATQYSHSCTRIKHHTLNLSSPVSARHLETGDLNPLVAELKKLSQLGRRSLKAIELDLTSDQQDRLSWLARSAPSPREWPAAWDLVPGDEVKRRREIHDVYGGNYGLRVAMSGQTANILVFNDSGRKSNFDYPRWHDEHLLVVGNDEFNQRLTHQNLALVGHANRGMALRVFDVEGNRCRYLGEFAAAHENPIDHWESDGQLQGRTRGRAAGLIASPRDVVVPVLRLRPLDRGRALAAHEPAKPTRRVHLSLHHTVTVAERAAARADSEGSANSHSKAAILRKLRALVERDPNSIAQLALLDDARVMSALIAHEQRRSALDRLRSIIETPANREQNIQDQLHSMPWVFGGEFMHETARRTLTATDQLDMSLIRSDGALHGVELKRADISNLVIGQGNHLVVGAEVNRAVGQAMNYLRSLDENRHQILNELKLDCRRASITVVIGHTSFVSADCDRHDVLETIRTYNSHLTRITVLTYDSLIESAEQALSAATSPSDAGRPETRGQ